MIFTQLLTPSLVFGSQSLQAGIDYSRSVYLLVINIGSILVLALKIIESKMSW